MGTLGVGNLLGTKDKAIVVPYRDSTGSWFLDAFTYTGARLPGFPYAAAGEVMNVSPTLFDLDGDGKDEIIFTRGTHVIALRGNGSVMWSNTVYYGSYVPGGGFQTVTNGFYWSATGAFINKLPVTSAFYSEVSSPMVVDVAGTGTNEVITAWKINPDTTGGGQDYNPFISAIFGGGEWGTVAEDWSGGVVTHDARTGKHTFTYHMHHLLEAGLGIGRATAGAPLNIYALNDGDCVVAFDKSKPFGLWGKGQLHKSFGKAQRLACGSYQLPIDVFTADIDGDGLDEALVSGTQLGNLITPSETILDDDGMLLWRKWLPHLNITHNYGWHNSSCMIPCNPDHDNHIDVLTFQHSYTISFRYWNGVELVDRAGWPKNFAPLLPTPPVVGDVDGDGQEEIVIGTYNPTAVPSTGNLMIFALDGTLKQSIPVPGGIKQIPALADVRGIGAVDVIYRSIPGVVYVQNFGSTSTNLVSWATHRGNMHRDGNFARNLFPPGTPLVTKKTSAYNSAAFTWTNATAAQAFRIYRAETAAGPFTQIATVTPATFAYTDTALRPGWQYFYEVRAVYATNTVASSPFAVLAGLNNNLLANAGFEEDDASHWDKWYTGDIDMTNMVASTNFAAAGKKSMRLILRNNTSGGSISQSDQYGIPDSCLYTTPGAFYSFGGWIKTAGLSVPTEQWFAWGSDKTGYNTNARPALPWPNYFTPHYMAGTGTSAWTYLNRTFKLPAGFPNVQFWHNYSTPAPVSGSVYIDNVFFRQLPAPTATNWTTLIPFGATWKYNINTPATNWTAPAFNDSTWPIGTAKLGNGTGPTNIATRLTQQRPNYYFRKQIWIDPQLAATLAPPATDPTDNSGAGGASIPARLLPFQDLLLSATCTDDSGNGYCPLRLYLNGTEAKTRIETVTAQGNETRYFDLTPFLNLLVPGTNTICVTLSNVWSDYDDIAFDIRLQAATGRAWNPGLNLTCANPHIPTLTADTPPGTIWQLQSTDNLLPAHWQPVQTLTNTLGLPLTIIDTGQNGRLLPAATKNRFYRLVPW